MSSTIILPAIDNNEPLAIQMILDLNKRTHFDNTAGDDFSKRRAARTIHAMVIICGLENPNEPVLGGTIVNRLFDLSRRVEDKLGELIETKPQTSETWDKFKSDKYFEAISIIKDLAAMPRRSRGYIFDSARESVEKTHF